MRPFLRHQQQHHHQLSTATSTTTTTTATTAVLLSLRRALFDNSRDSGAGGSPLAKDTKLPVSSLGQTNPHVGPWGTPGRAHAKTNMNTVNMMAHRRKTHVIDPEMIRSAQKKQTDLRTRSAQRKAQEEFDPDEALRQDSRAHRSTAGIVGESSTVPSSSSPLGVVADARQEAHHREHSTELFDTEAVAASRAHAAAVGAGDHAAGGDDSVSGAASRSKLEEELERLKGTKELPPWARFRSIPELMRRGSEAEVLNAEAAGKSEEEIADIKKSNEAKRAEYMEEMERRGRGEEPTPTDPNRVKQVSDDLIQQRLQLAERRRAERARRAAREKLEQQMAGDLPPIGSDEANLSGLTEEQQILHRKQVHPDKRAWKSKMHPRGAAQFVAETDAQSLERQKKYEEDLAAGLIQEKEPMKSSYQEFLNFDNAVHGPHSDNAGLVSEILTPTERRKIETERMMREARERLRPGKDDTMLKQPEVATVSRVVLEYDNEEKGGVTGFERSTQAEQTKEELMEELRTRRLEERKRRQQLRNEKQYSRRVQQEVEEEAEEGDAARAKLEAEMLASIKKRQAADSQLQRENQEFKQSRGGKTQQQQQQDDEEEEYHYSNAPAPELQQKLNTRESPFGTRSQQLKHLEQMGPEGDLSKRDVYQVQRWVRRKHAQDFQVHTKEAGIEFEREDIPEPVHAPRSMGRGGSRNIQEELDALGDDYEYLPTGEPGKLSPKPKHIVEAEAHRKRRAPPVDHSARPLPGFILFLADPTLPWRMLQQRLGMNKKVRVVEQADGTKVEEEYVEDIVDDGRWMKGDQREMNNQIINQVAVNSFIMTFFLLFFFGTMGPLG